MTTPERFGPYLLLKKIGRGGMAELYLARQTGVAGFERLVAIKRILPHLTEDREFVQMFVNEAKLAAQITHPNVAQIYDFGAVLGTYYMAMEYVMGKSLAAVLAQGQKLGTPIPVSAAAHITARIAAGLDHAYRGATVSGAPLGIIHRDVSPSNVILSDAGMVKLIDFGIAKATSSSQRTSAGVIKGKFGYIAPEYTRGQLDARADLFALGVIAHELLTGKRLFRGESDYATLIEVRERAIEKPSLHNTAVASDLDDIVMTALERDPALRWQTAAAMRAALSTAARGLGVVVGSSRIRDWISYIPTVEASFEPSVIIERIQPESRASQPTVSLRMASAGCQAFSTPSTERLRGRTPPRRSPILAVVAFAAVGIAAWQAWSALVVWSAGG